MSSAAGSPCEGMAESLIALCPGGSLKATGVGMLIELGLALLAAATWAVAVLAGVGR